jgi:LEA14-like dessication related protein
MRTSVIGSLGAALALTLGAGCAVLNRVSFEAPTAALKGVAVTGLGLKGGSLDLDVDVYNPNAYELRSPRLAVTIDLEQTHFGEATLERALQLPAQSHSMVRVPLSFTWQGVGAGARALLSKGSVNYALTGRIVVEAPFGERTVTLGTNGTVAVRDLVR